MQGFLPGPLPDIAMPSRKDRVKGTRLTAIVIPIWKQVNPGSGFQIGRAPATVRPAMGGSLGAGREEIAFGTVCV